MLLGHTVTPINLSSLKLFNSSFSVSAIIWCMVRLVKSYTYFPMIAIGNRDHTPSLANFQAMSDLITTI